MGLKRARKAVIKVLIYERVTHARSTTAVVPMFYTRVGLVLCYVFVVILAASNCSRTFVLERNWLEITINCNPHEFITRISTSSFLLGSLEKCASTINSRRERFLIDSTAPCMYLFALSSVF